MMVVVTLGGVTGFGTVGTGGGVQVVVVALVTFVRLVDLETHNMVVVLLKLVLVVQALFFLEFQII